MHPYSLLRLYCLMLTHLVFLKQMPHGDGRMSSHSLTAQYHMHSYYPAGIYKAQGLASTPSQQPLFSCDDGASETPAVCE